MKSSDSRTNSKYKSPYGCRTNSHCVLSNPSSSKDIGASRIKITASAAEKFEDKKSDSGEYSFVESSESEIEDRRCRQQFTFAVVDRLKISSEL